MLSETRRDHTKKCCKHPAINKVQKNVDNEIYNKVHTKMEHEIDRRTGAASAVMQPLYWTVMVKGSWRQSSRFTGRPTFQPSAAVMSFRWWPKEWGHGYKQSKGAQSRTAAPSYWKESFEVVQASDSDGSNPCGGVRTSNWEQTTGHAGEITSHLAWEGLGIPQKELEDVAWEKVVRNTLPNLLPLQPEPGKVTGNWWMDSENFFCWLVLT